MSMYSEYGHTFNSPQRSGNLITMYCPDCKIFQPLHVANYCSYCGKCKVEKVQASFDDLKKQEHRRNKVIKFSRKYVA